MDYVKAVKEWVMQQSKIPQTSIELNLMTVWYQSIYRISDIVFVRCFNFTYRQPLLYKFSKKHKIEANALKVLHGFADDVIRSRRKELTENPNENEDTLDEIGIRKKRAFLDLLLHSTINGKPLSDLEIREEVCTFIFGVIYYAAHVFSLSNLNQTFATLWEHESYWHIYFI